MKNVLFFFFSFLLAVLNGYIFWLFAINCVSYESPLNEMSRKEAGFVILFIAPFIETFLFQFLIYYLLFSILKIRNKFINIIIMSLIFSLMHQYNWLYMVMVFLGGIVLNNLYIYYKDKTRYSFLITVFFHFLYNLYGFLFVMH